jgi:tetratricopeptide (TPR) repeat protein
MKSSLSLRIVTLSTLLLLCGVSSIRAQGTEPFSHNPSHDPDPRAGKPQPGSAGVLNPTSGRRVTNSGDAVKRGDVCRQASKPDMNCAHGWYTLALELNKKESRAHLGLGEVYLATGKPQEAVGAYEQALTVDPRMVEAQVGLGRAYYKAQRFDKAIASFQEALVIKPTSVDALLGIADCYYAQRLFGEAVAGYRKVVGIKSNSIPAHYKLAVTYLMMNNREAAVEEQRTLKSLNKDAAMTFQKQLEQYDATKK